MAYKMEFQFNNADLQIILDIINAMPDIISTSEPFIPTDSGSDNNKLKLQDNNIDLQKLINTISLIPDIPDEAIEIIYDANGGLFNNNQTLNKVYYMLDGTYISELIIKKIATSGNVNDNGEKVGLLPKTGSIIVPVTIEGADSLNVEITYQNSDSSYACVFHGSITPNNQNYNSSISKKLSSRTPATKTFEVSGDSTNLYFYTVTESIAQNPNNYFYAIVSAVFQKEKANIFRLTGIEKIPTKEGYIFSGWYLEPECINKIDFANINHVNKSKTVYAGWLTQEQFNVLLDFDYIHNGDNTFTIVGWKGTLNGEKSTELVIPDSDMLIW